jgi:hypothetical protein
MSCARNEGACAARVCVCECVIKQLIALLEANVEIGVARHP